MSNLPREGKSSNGKVKRSMMFSNFSVKSERTLEPFVFLMRNFITRYLKIEEMKASLNIYILQAIDAVISEMVIR